MSLIKKLLIGSVLFVPMLAFAQATPTTLTTAQIQSVTALLQSYGVDPAVIANIESILESTTLPEKFVVGSRVETTVGLNVRETPTISAVKSCAQATGTLGTIVGGPTVADGYTWWNINYDTNCNGWSIKKYLTLSTISAPTLTPAPTPTPTATPTPTPSPTPIPAPLPTTIGNNPPIISLSTSVSTVAPNNYVYLYYKISNATSCTTDAGFNIIVINSISNGTVLLAPSKTTTYTFSCSGTGGTSVAKATVTVQ